MDKRISSPVYSYRETNHSGGGIAATVMGGVSLLLFVILTVVSAAGGGEGSRLMGAVGFTAFVIAFYGMVTGLGSFRDQCRSYIFCKVGTLLCGFMVAVWFLVFCVGLAL